MSVINLQQLKQSISLIKYKYKKPPVDSWRLLNTQGHYFIGSKAIPLIHCWLFSSFVSMLRKYWPRAQLDVR